MKYIYFLGALITGVLILIVFFQNIIFSSSYTARFLMSFVNFWVYNLLLIIVSILFGVFLTLFIKAILSGDSDFDDEFDL
jgi:hypothetical protein